MGREKEKMKERFSESASPLALSRVRTSVSSSVLSLPTEGLADICRVLMACGTSFGLPAFVVRACALCAARTGGILSEHCTRLSTTWVCALSSTKVMEVGEGLAKQL
jgi:hypothetical protein